MYLSLYVRTRRVQFGIIEGFAHNKIVLILKRYVYRRRRNMSLGENCTHRPGRRWQLMRYIYMNYNHNLRLSMCPLPHTRSLAPKLQQRRDGYGWRYSRQLLYFDILNPFFFFNKKKKTSRSIRFRYTSYVNTHYIISLSVIYTSLSQATNLYSNF